MEQPPVNARNMPEEREELDAETKEMKEEILRQIIQMKNIDIEDRQKLCKIRSDKKARKLIDKAKKAAKEVMNECEETLVTTNEVIYAGAYLITEKLNVKPKNYNNRRKHKQPLWKIKIEREINEIRGEVAILNELLRGVKVKSRKLNKMKKKYAMKNREDLPPLMETLKQKIQLKAQRIRRYEKRTKLNRQNNTFKSGKKKFYRELGSKQINVEKPPTRDEIEIFWKKIWGTHKEFNEWLKNTEWLKNEEARCNGLEKQEWNETTTAELKDALRKTQNGNHAE